MIRNALKSDVKELFTLESSVFSKDDFGLSKGSFYYHVEKNFLFLFEDKNKVVAYILWLKRKKFYRLYSLCVDKEYRNKKIAKKLLEYSFKNLSTNLYRLEVKCTNTLAIEFYKKNGFVVKKLLKNYYPNRIDGYLMEKKL